MLKNHDWYYDFSDDHEVWKAGNANIRLLRAIAETKQLDYMRMFDDFEKAMFSGEAFGTPKIQEPRLNEYL
jgi:hypothetical protein